MHQCEAVPMEYLLLSLSVTNKKVKFEQLDRVEVKTRWCYLTCLETYENVLSRLYRLNRKVFSALGQHCITFSNNKVGLSCH